MDDDARHPSRRLRRLLGDDALGLSGQTPPPPPLARAGEDGGADGAAVPREPVEDGTAGSGVPGEDVETDPARRPRIRRQAALGGAALAVLVGGALYALTSTAGAPPPGSGGSPSLSPTPGPGIGPQVPAAPGPRLDPAMSYDPATQSVLMYGGLVIAGNPAEASLSDTWLWNDAAWIPLSPATSPPPLTGALLAEDPSSQRLVLTGGETATTGSLFVPNASTWTWDGTTWAAQPEATLPAGVWPSALATDTATGQLILITTGPGCAPLGTWQWLAGNPGGRGGRWSRLLPTTAPPPATGYGLVFDAQTRSLDLLRSGGYCGQSSGAEAVGLWQWDGATWSPGPAIRGGPLSGTLEAGQSPLEGVWEVAGTPQGVLFVTATDTYILPTGGESAGFGPSPDNVGDAGIAYDPAAQVTVLFGGSCSSCTEVTHTPTSETWVAGPGGASWLPWPQPAPQP